MKWRLTACLALLALCCVSQPADAQIRITEWMYQGLLPEDPNDPSDAEIGEFFELTNIGLTPISLVGWTYDDNSRDPVASGFDLSPLGTLNPGQIAIVTEVSAAFFRTNWNLPSPVVKVLGGNDNNLSRNDEINIYDAGDNLIDRLTYNDNATVPPADPNIKGPRTQARSGNPVSDAVLGTNNASLWVLSNGLTGSPFGSYFSNLGEQGNPGIYPAVPEPTAFVMSTVGFLLAIGRRRHK